MDLESTEAMEERARGSPAVKDLSQTALRRVGEILVDPATDARVVLQAAKLALWAWDGTNKTVSEVLHMALPGCTQTDNGNGTVTITGGNGERVAKVAPYPAGVKLILNE